MDEPMFVDVYCGEERRRRWPGEYAGDERRAILEFETDQEPDQSPLAELVVVTTVPVPGAGRSEPPA